MKPLLARDPVLTRPVADVAQVMRLFIRQLLGRLGTGCEKTDDCRGGPIYSRRLI